MKPIYWNDEKDQKLIADGTRGFVGFDECLAAIQNGRILARLPHPNPRYAHQKIMILDIDNYAYVVPFIETDDGVFLKTVFPSRKYTAQYLRGK